MAYDLEMNLHKTQIAPSEAEDTAKTFQRDAAKPEETLVDAVGNAEVVELKCGVCLRGMPPNVRRVRGAGVE